jgi:hypothetical protein
VAKKHKYKVGYLIDVISKNPADYTRYTEVEADDETDAIKQAAKKLMIKDSSIIEWIDNLTGTYKEVWNQFCSIRLVFSTIEKIQ